MAGRGRGSRRARRRAGTRGRARERRHPAPTHATTAEPTARRSAQPLTPASLSAHLQRQPDVLKPQAVLSGHKRPLLRRPGHRHVPPSPCQVQPQRHKRLHVASGSHAAHEDAAAAAGRRHGCRGGGGSAVHEAASVGRSGGRAAPRGARRCPRALPAIRAVADAHLGGGPWALGYLWPRGAGCLFFFRVRACERGDAGMSAVDVVRL